MKHFLTSSSDLWSVEGGIVFVVVQKALYPVLFYMCVMNAGNPNVN